MVHLQKNNFPLTFPYKSRGCPKSLIQYLQTESVSKGIYPQKTPPSLRATSSINRGGAGDSSQRQGVFQLSLCL